MNERQFDGRKNFAADDEIERMLEDHFAKHGITHREIWRNFAIYTRRVFMKRFLALYELYRQVMDLPGDVVELGVYRGGSLMAFANFMEIRNMGDRQRRVIGFDNFRGFGSLEAKDGKEVPEVGKRDGGFDSEDFETALRDAIAIFDADRFIPYKARVELVKGNIEETVPHFVENNPGIRIALLHFDVDLYRPTLSALEILWPLVVPGGIVAFDEYGIPPWEGESRAVDEFFADKKVKLQRFDWSSNPGAYLVKD
ncbi:TylF/MycF/NovP-related O-methyltransferase [Thalassobaculum sp.]|uniref:TylF/MycF/NovP-related O-methyltransferase n=1 Tax=Thalassobaculum sp. TaxID=2022740 RepID=UPI0032ED6F34